MDQLASYIAGLDVRITFRDIAPDDARALEVVARAHDFTLAHPDRAGRTGGVTEFAADVVDRLGEYGTGAVAALHALDGTARVTVFSISCPALGRGVEQAVLTEIVARAARAGCDRVLFEYAETGRNGVAIDFLTAVAGHDWPTPSGRPVRVLTAALAGAT
jgi:predicted enzyme involved in methoxymalonyl-ACP biosynthesis